MHTDIHAAALEQIQTEIQRLEEELAEAKAVAAYHAARVSSGVSAPEHGTGSHKSNGSVGSGSSDRKSTDLKYATHLQEPKPYSNMTQYEAAQTVLLEAGKPLKTGDIVDALIDGGFPNADRKKLSVSLFTSLLRKTDLFEKVGSGLWQLVQ